MGQGHRELYEFTLLWFRKLCLRLSFPQIYQGKVTNIVRGACGKHHPLHKAPGVGARETPKDRNWRTKPPQPIDKSPVAWIEFPSKDPSPGDSYKSCDLAFHAPPDRTIPVTFPSKARSCRRTIPVTLHATIACERSQSGRKGLVMLWAMGKRGPTVTISVTLTLQPLKVRAQRAQIQIR
ncbi:hypothetical protein D9M68_234990 [compost metagenome]